MKQQMHCWGVLWRQDNLLDGKRECLIGCQHHTPTSLLFQTREAARDYIREKYSYLRSRPDLQREPYGWKMPIAVRVSVSVEVEST